MGHEDFAINQSPKTNPQENSLSQKIHQDEFQYSGFNGKNDRAQLGIETMEHRIGLGGKDKNEDQAWNEIEQELRKMTGEKKGPKEVTPEDRDKGTRELNHETNGMVEPGKETTALRQANEALMKGNLKNFAEAFKDLTIEQRKHVAEAMNQAFEKRGSSAHVTVDKEGNLIISGNFGEMEGTATKVDVNTGKSTEVKGRCYSNDFVITGQSSTNDGVSEFKRIGDQAARDFTSKPMGPFGDSRNTINPQSLESPRYKDKDLTLTPLWKDGRYEARRLH